MEANKNRLNIFLDLDTMKTYLDNHVPEDLELQKVFVDCAFTVDITDAPHRLYYRAGQESVELELDRRGIMYMTEETESLKEAYLTLDPNGQIQGNAPQELQNIMQLYLMFCLNMSAWLREQDAFDKYSNLNPETQGAMVEERSGRIELRPVSGDERPDLACRLFTGDVKMMRPYSADVMRGVILDAMPLEKKEAAAEAGDTKMMQHLFDYYMGNTVSAHKDLERNSRKLLKLMKAAVGEASDNDGEEEEEEQDTRNPEKAFYWLKKLAESGDAEAMDMLSIFYMKAFGTERDFRKAFEWKKEALESGFEEDREQNQAQSTDEGMNQSLLSSAEIKEKAEAGDTGAQASYARVLALIAQYHPELGSDEDEKEAFQWAQKSAAKSDFDGILTLARFYQDGTGTAKDESKAFRLIERAANKGHAPSQARLGQMYFQGEGTKENPQAAFEWCKKAAEAGDRNGMSNLAACYLLGKGVDQDADKAVEWLQKAAELGDEGAKGLLEKLGAPLKPQPSTLEEAIKAAEEGSVEAMKMLANYYINRPGGREDLYEAHKWMKMAADRGDEEARESCQRLEAAFNGETISFEDAKSDAESGEPGAQKILADYYAAGYKTPRDLVKALYWMKKAAASGDPRFAEQAQDFVDNFSDIEEVIRKANAGDPFAQAQLAENYIEISQNYPDYDQAKGQHEAFELAEKSAAKNDPLGLFALGMCYENGYGTEVDLDKAYAFYQQSAQLGNPRGELSLSQAYMMGRGTDYDVEAAMEWFHKAEDHGNPEAEKVRELYPQLMLMMAMDMLGKGEKSGRPDPVLGAKYMQHAAEFGNAAAQHFLGVMLVNGNKIEQDFEKGIEWIRKAKENGNEQAAESLAKYDRPEVYHIAANKEFAKKDKADKEKIFRLLKHAAECGYAPAMGNYGYFLVLGLGGELDYNAGMSWLKKAADQGDENARKTLEKQAKPDALNLAAMAALTYNAKNGIGDNTRAYQLLRQAAEAGSAEANNTLGVLYADPDKAAQKFGRIGERDLDAARSYFEKALSIKPDLTQAQNNLEKLADVKAAEKTGREQNSELKWAIAVRKKSLGKAEATQPAAKPEPEKTDEPAQEQAATAEPPAAPAPKPETEWEKQERERKEWQEKGSCQYCGGSFKKGLFGAKCLRCGKKKDY